MTFIREKRGLETPIILNEVLISLSHMSRTEPWSVRLQTGSLGSNSWSTNVKMYSCCIADIMYLFLHKWCPAVNGTLDEFLYLGQQDYMRLAYTTLVQFACIAELTRWIWIVSKRRRIFFTTISSCSRP